MYDRIYIAGPSFHTWNIYPLQTYKTARCKRGEEVWYKMNILGRHVDSTDVSTVLLSSVVWDMCIGGEKKWLVRHASETKFDKCGSTSVWNRGNFRLCFFHYETLGSSGAVECAWCNCGEHCSKTLSSWFMYIRKKEHTYEINTSPWLIVLAIMYGMFT